MRVGVHRIVGLICGSVGVLTAVLNIIAVVNRVALSNGSIPRWNYYNLGLGILVIGLSLIKKDRINVGIGSKTWTLDLERLNMSIQFIILLLITTFAVLSDHENQWIIPMMMLTGLMGIKYRLLGKRGLVFLMAFFALAVEYSAFFDGKFMRGIYVLIFASFFFGISLVMYYDELIRYLNLTKKYHTRLIEVENRLEKISGDRLDPHTMGFTPRELEVLKELCLTYSSNQELAESLGIKEQTVKTHLMNIFDKAGVDDRHQLIDLFRHAFVE